MVRPRLSEFFDAVFAGRLRFSLPLGAEARALVRAGHLDCWKCGVQTRIITGIDISVGPYELPFSVPRFDQHLEVFDTVWRRMPERLGIGAITPRFSRTQARAYLSNGCAHCGALIGEFHEHEAWHDQEVVSEFAIVIDERWRAAIRDHDGYGDRWGVYAFPRSQGA